MYVLDNDTDRSVLPRIVFVEPRFLNPKQCGVILPHLLRRSVDNLFYHPESNNGHNWRRRIYNNVVPFANVGFYLAQFDCFFFLDNLIRKLRLNRNEQIFFYVVCFPHLPSVYSWLKISLLTGTGD